MEAGWERTWMGTQGAEGRGSLETGKGPKSVCP